MSGVIKETVGGRTRIRGPLRIRLEFAHDCAQVIQSGSQRTRGRTSPVDNTLRAHVCAVLNWGIFNRSQVAQLAGLSRASVNRLTKDMERRPGTLRGRITPEGMLLLTQAMRLEHSGQRVDYGVVAVEMTNSGTSPNVARALCGLTIAKFNRARSEHGESDDLLAEIRSLDPGHPEAGQDFGWDLDPHPAGERPGAGEEAPEADHPGELPGAAAGDAELDAAPAEDEGKRPKQPLLDPATLQGEELRIALEEGRAWYPPVENPIDESGDSYLQGSRIAPPDDFMAAFEALEQADE